MNRWDKVTQVFLGYVKEISPRSLSELCHRALRTMCKQVHLAMKFVTENHIWFASCPSNVKITLVIWGQLNYSWRSWIIAGSLFRWHIMTYHIYKDLIYSKFIIIILKMQFIQSKKSYFEKHFENFWKFVIFGGKITKNDNQDEFPDYNEFNLHSTFSFFHVNHQKCPLKDWMKL